MRNAESPPSPPAAGTPADFVAEMRRLKAYSGLTFRELSRRAAAAGDVMPYSTVATTLGRDRLPGESLVASFTRACGCTPEQVDEWIAARRRIAAETAVAGSPTNGGEEPADGRDRFAPGDPPPVANRS
ncbi:MAG: helix-turn-helix domain-containing protein [Actinomycetes bacterium]